MFKISMMCGIWQTVVDFFMGIFANIPQFIYFIYTCCASFLDFLQYVSRKLVGLDVYYINGEAVQGDIVQSFIGGIIGIENGAQYSTISTVFWSMVIFGIILIVLTTIFSIIKAHYNYDDKKSNPVAIVFASLKSLSLMAVVPVVCFLGILLSNTLLGAVDNITAPSSSMQIEQVFETSSVNYDDIFASNSPTSVSSRLFERGEGTSSYKTYSSYDFFGFGAYTNSTTFSSILFEVSCNSANRVRYGSYSAASKTSNNKTWSDFEIFTSDVDSETDQVENVASMIDYAFANNLILKERQTASMLGKESIALVSSFAYWQSAAWYAGVINFSSFSKYNVGLVWYYYNLWIFNFFIAIAGMITCLTLFTSIVFGLIVRMFEMIGMFVVFPALVGISPLDDQKAFKEWKGKFLSNVLIGYGTVVGLNIAFLLLRELDNIAFIGVPFLDGIINIIIMLSLFMVIKDLIKLFSGFVKGKDANAEGSNVKKEMMEPAQKAASTALKTASIAMKFTGAGAAAGIAISKISQAMKAKKAANASNAADAELMGRDDFTNFEQDKQNEEILKQEMDSDKEVLDDKVEGLRELFATTKPKATPTKKERQIMNKYGIDNSVRDDFYKRFQKNEKYINDLDLSDEENHKMKKQFKEELIDEFIEEFSANSAEGQKYNNSKDKYDDLVNKNNLLEDIYEKQKQEILSRKKERSPFVKNLLNLKDQSLKLAGKLTGFASVKKSFDDAGVVDDGKMLMQGFFKSFNIFVQDAKVKKDKNKEIQQEQFAKAQQQQSELTNKMLNEVKMLANNIVKINDASGENDSKDAQSVKSRKNKLIELYVKIDGKEFDFKGINMVQKLANELKNQSIFTTFKKFAKRYKMECDNIDKNKALSEDLKKNKKKQKRIELVEEIVKNFER